MVVNRFSNILKIFIFAIFPVYASDFDWKLYVGVGPASSKNLSYILPEDTFSVPSVNGLKHNCKVTKVDAGERDLICVDEKTGQKSGTRLFCNLNEPAKSRWLLIWSDNKLDKSDQWLILSCEYKDKTKFSGYSFGKCDPGPF